MVVFTCHHCGDPVKKPVVEKHYNTKCHYRNIQLTCVDCLKDFSTDNYDSHNQCMTEEKRYSAKGTFIKEEKGRKKQEMYVEMIQNLLNSEELTLTPGQRNLLEVCSRHDNVPRKPKPFENFMRCVARPYFKNNNNTKDVHIVFNIIEGAWKKTAEPGTSSANEKESRTLNVKEEIGSNNETRKNLKKKRSDKSLSLDVETNSEIMEEKTCNVNGEEYTNDQSQIDLKKRKKKRQSDESFKTDSIDQVNVVSPGENIKNANEDVLGSESSKKKKEKHRKRSLSLVNEGEENLKENGSPGNEEAINTKVSTTDDVKENVNEISKKQLKKQKKYEKYLAELENEAKSNVNQIAMNAEVEEPLKNEKKKKKKLPGNALESVGLTVDSNAVNISSTAVRADSKRIKKRKLEESAIETPTKKIKEVSEEGEEVSAVATFNWSDVITRVLQSRPDKELSLKKLGKKVVSEYQTVKEDHRTYEELLAKFNKKVNKIKGVRVLRDRAKLIE